MKFQMHLWGVPAGPANFESNKGFTLIELMVVLTVLTLILGTTVSIFISILKGQSRAIKEQELFSQVSYAAEYMSKLIQGAVQDSSGVCLGLSFAGYNYVLTHFDSVDGFYQGIKFIADGNTCQEFFLDAGGSLKEIKDLNDPQNILSDKFIVEYARFIINGNKILQGSSQRDSIQPRVTFVLDVQTQGSQNQQEKIIQTTVSQRNLNIK